LATVSILIKLKEKDFFIAAFQKNQLTASPHIKRAKENSVNPKSEDLIRRWLKHLQDIRIVNLNDEYFAIPGRHEADLAIFTIQSLFEKIRGQNRKDYG
jgi:hypothetical protein